MPVHIPRLSWSCALSRLVMATLAALLLALALALSGPAPVSAATRPADARPVVLQPDAKLFILAAGQRLTGPWLAWWLSHPDHSATGLPVSGIVLDGDHYSQWFQYARLDVPLERWQDNTDASIQFAPLGQSVAARADYAKWLDAFKSLAGASEDVRFFPDTGHTLRMAIRAAYEQPGVPERLGPPISEEFGGQGDPVYQFFQFGALQWTPVGGAQLVEIGTLDAVLSGHLGVPLQPPGDVLTDADLTLDVDEAGSADAAIADAGRSRTAGVLVYWSSLVQGEHWIEVDLSEHTVTAWIDDLPVLTSTTVTGAEQSPTPTGHFSIYMMNRTQTLNGVTWDGTPYHEVDTPWVMYFYEDYAVHASTWRTEFGFSASPGCVIPPNEVAKQLWLFAEIGTRVEVHK
jgi:hypothetical protein